MFDQTICAVIGTCFRLAWTRLLTGDGQLGSNPQPEAKLGEKSDSLRNQAFTLVTLWLRVKSGFCNSCGNAAFYSVNASDARR